jgi:CheY-like chemotaxis protein
VIRADVVQVEQILMNLAANARDAMPDGGSLWVRTDSVGPDASGSRPDRNRNVDGYVRITVQDSGTGMDERTRAHIFEPFFTTKERGRGTGLGLSTVCAVMEQLGGDIRVDSRPGYGTTFELYFPCSGGASSTLEPDRWERHRLQGTVLFVEDDTLVRMTVRRYLEELGLDVLDAKDPVQAQRLCHAHEGPIDILVSDIVLPGMRGTKLAAVLRQLYPDLRVLFISANPEFAQPGMSTIDAAPVLRKPFTKADLERTLCGLMTPREGAPRRTLLLVEDEPIARDALRQLLEERGFRVLAAASPPHAFEVIAEHTGTWVTCFNSRCIEAWSPMIRSKP